MSSNMPPGYSDDGDAPTHGKDTAMWQELQPIIEKFRKWAKDHRDYLNDEDHQRIGVIATQLDDLSEDIGQPL